MNTRGRLPIISFFCITLFSGSISLAAILDPSAQAFLNELAASNGKPIYTLNPEDARKGLDTLQETPRKKLPADIQDLTIPGGPYGTIDIRIIRPKGNEEMLPVIIYMHGGGWVLGNEHTHDALIRQIADGAKAAVVFVKYIPAPESQYPNIHEEGYSAAEWIAKNGKKLNLDISRMAIAGDSVGGELATAIAMMAQERGGPNFKFQLLFYPVTDANFSTGSYEQFAKGYYLERKGMQWFWDMYVPDKEMRNEPYASPLKASLEQLSTLPPALIFVNEIDVLRDEGEAYARKLIQAGVPTGSLRLLGMIHDSVMLNALADAPAVKAAIVAGNNALKQALAKR